MLDWRKHGVKKIGIYERELGISIQELYEYERGIRLDEKTIPVEEIFPWYMPDGGGFVILGMTDLTKIWIRQGLDYFTRITTRVHEWLHNKYRETAEHLIREYTAGIMATSPAYAV